MSTVSSRLLAGLCVLVVALGACGSGSQPKPPATPAPACQQEKPANLSLSGIAYGPYHTGQDPNYAVYPSAEEVAADIPTLACLTGSIRIYSSLGPASDIVRDAVRAHLTVNLGIWLGRDSAANEREMTAGMQLMSSTAVTTVTVGNEVLLRGDLTVDQLRSAIKRVRAAAAGVRHTVRVTTADVDGSWLAHPDLAPDVDILTVHLYPFWQQVPIAGAIQALDRSYAKIRSTFHGKRIVIGETGWPSDGPAQGGAVPSGANQSVYFRGFFDWARRQNADYYYFDAFDESWKTDEAGVGTHWGLYREDGVLKPALSDLLPAASLDTLKQRSFRDVYVGSLAAGLDIGIDTSGQQRNWLTANLGVLTLAYPAGQDWGSMFVTFGKPVPPGNRPGMDLSPYRSLTVEMRRADTGGGEGCVRLGVKDKTQADDGRETTVLECSIGGEWGTIRVPLSAFKSADLTHLYVVFEVVFSHDPMTIQVRNVRYSPDDAPWPSPEPTLAPTPTPTPIPTPPPPPSGPPHIEFTSVPPIGSANHLTGRVWGVDPSRYAVAVFIQVDGLWWVKPYWDSPLTRFAADGTWTCDIITGGHDQDATAIRAFVVPRDISLPAEPSIGDVQPHAVAQVSVNR